MAAAVAAVLFRRLEVVTAAVLFRQLEATAAGLFRRLQGGMEERKRRSWSMLKR